MKVRLQNLFFVSAMACILFLALSLRLSGAVEASAQQHDAKSAEEQKQPDVKHQLAEESSEAAPHEEHDEHAKYKYSASVRYLAAKTGMSTEAAYWSSLLLNFAIVAGAIGFLVGKKAPGFFRNRTSAIQKGIEEARRASEDARRRLNDIEGRLARLDSEIAGIESNAETQAKDEEARLRAAVEEERKKIVRSAEQEIARAASNARRDLKNYTTELAVDLAEKKIKIDAATDAEILRDFVDQLETGNGTSRRNS
jgi:F-type H+-transporting ATPase subunit b